MAADFEVQLVPPVPVHCFQLMEGCFSDCWVPTCWPRTAARRERDASATLLYMMKERRFNQDAGEEGKLGVRSPLYALRGPGLLHQ